MVRILLAVRHPVTSRLIFAPCKRGGDHLLMGARIGHTAFSTTDAKGKTTPET